MRTEFLCISVLRVASGPRVKLASCKSPGVSLTLWCFVVYSTRRFVVLSYLVPFCSCVFQSF